MKKAKKVSIIFGTRPEAIKLSPIILGLREYPQFESNVCVTAQHRELLDQVLSVFRIKPDVDLDLMRPNQGLSDLTARAISALDVYFKQYQPDLILVQGDTTTVLAASLAAFYHKIKIGHIEAGLRTWDKYSPYPEEINRVLTTHLADYHFAPTGWAKSNLIREGVPKERIFITGNTVIDALQIALKSIRNHQPDITGLTKSLLNRSDPRPLVLITGHRRESFGAGFESICQAIARLADRFPQTAFVYPVHLNPNVRKPVFKILSNRKNVHLIGPLSYLPFVALMDRCILVLTDSGGIQEEAPSLGKPVLVMRDRTERPEAIKAGTAKLVGTDSNRIFKSVSNLLTDPRAYAAMVNRKNPYGDGKASSRIIEILKRD